MKNPRYSRTQTALFKELKPSKKPRYPNPRKSNPRYSRSPCNFEKAKITKEEIERPDLVTRGSLNVDNSKTFKKREEAKSDNKKEELSAKIHDLCRQKSQVDGSVLKSTLMLNSPSN